MPIPTADDVMAALDTYNAAPDTTEALDAMNAVMDRYMAATGETDLDEALDRALRDRTKH
jgi:hypothetical protein